MNHLGYKFIRSIRYSTKIDLIFLDMTLKSKLTANCRVLLSWNDNPLSFNYDRYNIFYQNMAQWLSPTALRLSTGLKLLEKNYCKGLKPIIKVFEHNIDDESGDGNPELAHAKLFSDSCSIFSQVTYNKLLIKVKPLPTTLTLHERSLSLFSENVYKMLGAAVAQETHALPQLEHLYAGYESLKFRFTDDEWNRVKYFYDVHLNGTEARHAEDLHKTVWSILNNDEKKNLFHDGYDEFMLLLNDFWSGLENELYFIA